MWLTWHDSCDLWTLGGHTCLSLQDLAHGMDAIPCIWETMDDECCTLRMENVAFGGSLVSLEDEVAPFSTWTFSFGGLGHHPLSLDVIFEARVSWMRWFRRWFDRRPMT
jgi:hypothetical protein